MLSSDCHNEIKSEAPDEQVPALPSAEFLTRRNCNKPEENPQIAATPDLSLTRFLFLNLNCTEMENAQPHQLLAPRKIHDFA